MRRRDFLKQATVLGMTSLTSSCSNDSHWKAGVFRRTKSSRVAILKVASYREDLVRVILEGIKACELSVSGKNVLLKPNLVEYEKDTVINTHPAVVGAAIEAFLQLGSREVKVGEGPGHRRDTDGLLAASGLLPYLKETGSSFVDLNLDDLKKVTLLSTFMGIDTLYIAESVLSTDLLISMPKIKTHHWAGMTLSMKNMFGVIPGVKYGWPKNFLHWHGIQESIVDINSTVPPHFVIADGIIGMEGNGPIQGKPKPCGVLVFGHDPVAVDATCARVVGLNPEKIDYLRMAGQFLGNLEERQIEQIGEAISRVQTRFDVIEGFEHLRS